LKNYVGQSTINIVETHEWSSKVAQPAALGRLPALRLTSAKNFKRHECYDVIQEIHTMGSPVTYRTAADEYFDEGFAVGIAEGKAEGEANAILLFLKTSHGRIPKSIRDAVRAITDRKVLEKLTILAAKCKSLEEFNKALK